MRPGRSRAIRWAGLVWIPLGCGGGGDLIQPPPPPAPLGPIPLVATVPVPANYGIHDTFVRDGLAFACLWNTGVAIYDVGHGIRGGRPASPVQVSLFEPSAAPLENPAIHNAWWFHNPGAGETRYLFLGQEGPGIVGASSSGDIKVLDVSDLAAPREVAFYHRDGSGTHNFWMDEPAAVLYAAYYDGGVVALDVSGALQGDLAARELAALRPAVGSNYVWGVMLAGSRLYASDMLNGFWQLDPRTLAPVAGGFNVPSRFSSDLWVQGGYAYTGTWGGAPRQGNRGDALLVWQLGPDGAPALIDSVVVDSIRTVSDLEVSDDGRLLLFSAEGGTGAGLYLADLDDPARPIIVADIAIAEGIHTATFGRIADRLYVFAAKNPPNPALLVFAVPDPP